MTGLQGIALLDISIVCLACLTWGTLKLRVWAWWGALVTIGLLTISALGTFATASYADILSSMRFAPMEMDILGGLPFQGIHFAMFIGLPLLITLGLIVYARRYFGAGNLTPSRRQV